MPSLLYTRNSQPYACQDVCMVHIHSEGMLGWHGRAPTAHLAVAIRLGRLVRHAAACICCGRLTEPRRIFCIDDIWQCVCGVQLCVACLWYAMTTSRKKKFVVLQYKQCSAIRLHTNAHLHWPALTILKILVAAMGEHVPADCASCLGLACLNFSGSHWLWDHWLWDKFESVNLSLHKPGSPICVIQTLNFNDLQLQVLHVSPGSLSQSYQWAGVNMMNRSQRHIEWLVAMWNRCHWTRRTCLVESSPSTGEESSPFLQLLALDVWPCSMQSMLLAHWNIHYWTALYQRGICWAVTMRMQLL